MEERCILISPQKVAKEGHSHVFSDFIQDEYDRIFNNGVIPPDMSICWLMSQLKISDIVRKIEQTYYSPHLRYYFHYPIDFLIKLTVVMTYRRIAYSHA